MSTIADRVRTAQDKDGMLRRALERIIQLYTDNFVKDAKGKDGVVYGWRQGLCLETQAYPDSIHQDSFPDVIYGPDREYRTTTIYKFE